MIPCAMVAKASVPWSLTSLIWIKPHVLPPPDVKTSPMNLQVTAFYKKNSKWSFPSNQAFSVVKDGWLLTHDLSSFFLMLAEQTLGELQHIQRVSSQESHVSASALIRANSSERRLLCEGMRTLMRQGGKTQEPTPHFSLFLASAGCLSELVNQGEKAPTCSRVRIVCVCVCWCMHPCVYDDILLSLQPHKRQGFPINTHIKEVEREKEIMEEMERRVTLAAANRVGSESLWVMWAWQTSASRPSITSVTITTRSLIPRLQSRRVDVGGRSLCHWATITRLQLLGRLMELGDPSCFFCFGGGGLSPVEIHQICWREREESKPVKKSLEQSKDKTQRLEGWTLWATRDLSRADTQGLGVDDVTDRKALISFGSKGIAVCVCKVHGDATEIKK